MGNHRFYSLFSIVGLAFVCLTLGGCTPSEIEARQDTPGNAVKVYLEIAYGVQAASKPIGKMEEVVTKEDWEWFQSSYHDIGSNVTMDVALSGGIDPQQEELIRKHTALKTLITSGPYYTSCEILEENENGKEATVKVRQRIQLQTTRDYVIRLIKQGRFWKVADFAGGKGGGNMTVPDIPENQPEEDEEEEIGSAPAGGAPVAAPPASFDSIGAPPAAPANPFPPAGGGFGAPPAAATPAVAQTPYVDPAIAPADMLVQRAKQAWDQGQQASSIELAKKALGIYQRNLPPDDPRVLNTQNMIRAAEQMNP